MDHEFPHMVGKDPNYVIPLLTQDRLFYLPTVTYERGCNNPSCRHCLERMRTPPNEDEVDKVMKSYNFEEAKWAVMSRAKEVKTTMALENSRRKTDLIRWYTPFEYNMKEAVAGNVQEVFQGREQRSTLEEAGEQFRRKTKMKELGVKKFGSNDKHHLRTRRIGLKEAHRLFGHVGMDEETLIEAEKALEYNDLVIGPCYDGGYYLIGMKKLNYKLFKGISWGEKKVFKQTLSKVSENSVYYLDIKNDIDNEQSFKSHKSLYDLYRKTFFKKC